MAKTTVEQLGEFGQSVWLDNINRAMLTTGKLKQAIGVGLRGMTSNPTIFEQALGAGSDYDRQIQELIAAGKSTFEIYDALTVQDIQDAADIFLPVYQQTQGLDGYVSLEVNPLLAYEEDQTIKEAQRLFTKVNRPNVMFKIPATDEGIEATEELLAEGINLNVTLIFSLAQYKKVAAAYLRGLKRLLQTGADLSKLRSVASVFVSRIDNVVDKQLAERDRQGATGLLGQAAVANMNIIYREFVSIFSSDEFRQLANQGANLQRVLWASTSTKNPAYSDIKYATELIAKDTVNTLPDQTLAAFLDHGQVATALTADASAADQAIVQLSNIGIDVNAVCAQLLKDGVAAFEKSFQSLLDSLSKKEKVLCK
ncbi:transaldolase [Candidatus Omnitrophota bacterium]